VVVCLAGSVRAEQEPMNAVVLVLGRLGPVVSAGTVSTSRCLCDLRLLIRQPLTGQRRPSQGVRDDRVIQEGRAEISTQPREVVASLTSSSRSCTPECQLRPVYRDGWTHFVDHLRLGRRVILILDDYRLRGSHLAI
jgi:hypothetical protein